MIHSKDNGLHSILAEFKHEFKNGWSAILFATENNSGISIASLEKESVLQITKKNFQDKVICILQGEAVTIAGEDKNDLNKFAVYIMQPPSIKIWSKTDLLFLVVEFTEKNKNKESK